MSWRTASYFSSRPTAATNSSRYLTAIPRTPGIPGTIFIRRDARRLARRRKPRGNFPRRSLAFLIENLCTTPLPAAGPCVARFPHFWSPAPADKHTYIDAINGKTVTRETLLRYTFKSHPVNVLIRGFLWKNSPLGWIWLPEALLALSVWLMRRRVVPST